LVQPNDIVTLLRIPPPNLPLFRFCFGDTNVLFHKILSTFGPSPFFAIIACGNSFNFLHRPSTFLYSTPIWHVFFPTTASFLWHFSRVVFPLWPHFQHPSPHFGRLFLNEGSFSQDHRSVNSVFLPTRPCGPTAFSPYICGRFCLVFFAPQPAPFLSKPGFVCGWPNFVRAHYVPPHFFLCLFFFLPAFFSPSPGPSNSFGSSKNRFLPLGFHYFWIS